tara:strand:+ start:226 stop:417 length:192 start_codon:yes stop_codon:yes gene_type:complete
MTIEDKIEAHLGLTPNEYISRAFWSYRHMREVVLDMFLEGIDDVDRSDILQWIWDEVEQEDNR